MTQARFMITNGGPHTPERWAMETAKDIFDINPSMAGGRMIEAHKVQTAIAEALISHHAIVQSNERSLLSSAPAARLAADDMADRAEAVDEASLAMADIKAVLAGSPWADYLDLPERAKAVRAVIASHMMTSKNIERGWHRDQNPA